MSGTSVDHSCSKALADNSPNKSQAQAVPSLLLVRRCAECRALEEGTPRRAWPLAELGACRLQSGSPSLFFWDTLLELWFNYST